MYKQVETQEEQILFNQIYQSAFNEMDYNAVYEDNLDTIDLLIENKYNECSGTIQFHKFNPHSKRTILEYPEIFLESESIAGVEAKYIYEVDKVAVKDSERKNGTLDNIIETVYHFTKKNDIRYLVAEMNPLFFRALRINYGLEPIKASKMVKVFDGKSSVQPTILVMERIWAQYEIKKASVEAAKGITI